MDVMVVVFGEVLRQVFQNTSQCQEFLANRLQRRRSPIIFRREASWHSSKPQEYVPEGGKEHIPYNPLVPRG
jgi:hypothetical protein